MKNIYLFFALFWALSLFGQSRKQYKGDYQLRTYVGTANYYYYYNEEDKPVKDGPFSFYRKGKNMANQNLTLSIKGKFKAGQPTGSWVFSLQSANSKQYITAQYENGVPVGNWSLSRWSNAVSKVPREVKAKLQYKNGQLLSYEVTGSGSTFSSNFSLKGKANAENQLEGETVVRVMNQNNAWVKEVCQYQAGKLLEQKMYSDRTGKVIHEQIITAEKKEIFEQLLAGAASADLGYELSENLCKVEAGWDGVERMQPCGILGNAFYNSIFREMTNLPQPRLFMREMTKAPTWADIQAENEQKDERYKRKDDHLRRRLEDRLMQSYWQKYGLDEIQKYAKDRIFYQVSMGELPAIPNHWRYRNRSGMPQDSVLSKIADLFQPAMQELDSLLRIDITLAQKKLDLLLEDAQVWRILLQQEKIDPLFIQKLWATEDREEIYLLLKNYAAKTDPFKQKPVLDEK